jgi:DNA invertase Pin-like site-specific DNA recombinase
MDGIAAETMNRVAQAAEKIERLEPRLLAARAELYAAIRDAHAEGATFATIARVAGLSREWVRRIVKERLGYL